MPPSGKDVVKALQKAGYDIKRVRGSHHIMSDATGRTVTIPVHRNQDLARGTYRNILADIAMTDSELRDLI